MELHLENFREEYTRGGLDRSDLNDDPMVQSKPGWSRPLRREFPIQMQ